MQNNNQGIYNEFKVNGKFKDFFNISEIECKFSIIITCIVLLSLYYFKVYENFNEFVEAFKSLSQNIGIALVTLLGIIFAGITLIISILSKNIIYQIDKLNGKGVTKKLLVSFKFLVVNIGFAIMLFFYIYIILCIKSIYVDKVVFYVLLAAIIYYFCFLIFYTVSIILNTIRIYFIVNSYETILEEKRTVIDSANEIRIDFILNSILDNISKKEYINSLNEYIDNSNIQNKEDVKKYLNDYYN